MTSEYDNTDHWLLVDNRCGKDYVSKRADVPQQWSPVQTGKGLTWNSQQGHYVILRHKADGPYTVYRDGIALPLAFYSLLREAKERAVKNARGQDRMHVA